MTPTKELLERAVSVLTIHAVPPSTIQTEREAAQAAIAGKDVGIERKWNVGDAYYTAVFDGDIRIKGPIQTKGAWA